jgi:hypothetical protein
MKNEFFISKLYAIALQNPLKLFQIKKGYPFLDSLQYTKFKKIIYRSTLFKSTI